MNTAERNVLIAGLTIVRDFFAHFKATAWAEPVTAAIDKLHEQQKHAALHPEREDHR